MFIPLISGSMARMVAVSVVSPIELVRTKMQSQKKSFSGKFVTQKPTYKKTNIQESTITTFFGVLFKQINWMFSYKFNL